MSVLHLNIASFPVQVERLAEPKLRGRPVVIVASRSPRSPLLCVSSEAHRLGVRKGMSQRKAEGYERRLICLPPNPTLYQKAQRSILKVVSKYTPRYEPMRLGSVFLDMQGMELLLGKPREAAAKLCGELISNLGLGPALGVGQNKLVARIAAKIMHTQGFCEIFPGNEENFLHPLDVDLLPGVGRVTSSRLLRDLGVRCIGDLADIPVALLVQLFGKGGYELHRKAHGVDESDVGMGLDYSDVAAAPLEQERVLEEPSNDDGFLLSCLWCLVEALGFRLRAEAKVAGRGYLTGTYVDREHTTLNFTIRPPSNSDFILFYSCESRWEKFFVRRTRLKSLSLRLSELQPSFEQLDFTEDRKEKKLLVALDALRRKHGHGVVNFGRSPGVAGGRSVSPRVGRTSPATF